MKTIICGAGQVGYGIAERLAAEGNDVAIIDNEPELVQRVNDMLDARAFLGHASDPDVIQEAGAADADMLIAVTLHDEVNMVARQVAHSLFEVPTKIARIRSQSYLSKAWSNLFTRDHLPIDVTISPEIEVGEMVLRRLNQPGAFEAMSFGDGNISVVGVTCDENCPIVDTPLKQLTDLFPDLPAVIVGIVRDGRLFVPHVEDHMLVGDDAYFVAQHDQVTRTLKIFGHEEQQARRIVIAGGGNIGLYVARAIEENHPTIRVKIVEQDRQRAVGIAEELTRTIVLHGDALNEELLREADVNQADTIVALTNDDQANILACVLARQLGCERNLCLVNSAGYNNVIRSLGINAQINPRAVTVSRILQHVRRGRIRAVQSVHNGDAEVIEAEALDTAPVVGQTLRDLDLGEGVRIGAILRKDEVIMPSGETEIRARDRVVVFATADHVREVEQLFRVSLEFF
ncbi:MAG: Trk system potassium transporter TrkA [Hyphomicrobiaceae bacterium]